MYLLFSTFLIISSINFLPIFSFISLILLNWLLLYTAPTCFLYFSIIIFAISLSTFKYCVMSEKETPAPNLKYITSLLVPLGKVFNTFSLCFLWLHLFTWERIVLSVKLKVWDNFHIWTPSLYAFWIFFFVLKNHYF